MSLPVEFLSGADGDLQQIFNQLEDYLEGLGVEFILALDAYLARISTFPEIAPMYVQPVRRQVMRGFPYGIFYVPHPGRMLVSAILDLRQNPEVIERRLGQSRS